jgi:hypothetical protein
MLRLGKAESIAFVPFIQSVNKTEWEDTNRRNFFWTSYKNDKGISNSSNATIWDFSANLVVNDIQLAPISQNHTTGISSKYAFVEFVFENR